MRRPNRKIFLPLYALLLLWVLLFPQINIPQAIEIREEEVREFTKQYRNQYTRKDIDGFISLFSSKAIQNGRDRFNEIRGIYSDFFDKSQELRFHLEDLEIKIYKEVLIFRLFYESAASVEAQYRVDQILKKEGKKQAWEGNIRWILVRENGALRILSLDFKHRKSR